MKPGSTILLFHDLITTLLMHAGHDVKFFDCVFIYPVIFSGKQVLKETQDFLDLSTCLIINQKTRVYLLDHVSIDIFIQLLEKEHSIGLVYNVY